MSFPFNNCAHRAACAGLLLTLASAAMILTPQTTNLEGENLATLDGQPVTPATRLLDLAHVPAANQPAVISLAHAGDNFVLSGRAPVDLPPQSFHVTQDATVAQLLRWIEKTNDQSAGIISARENRLPRDFAGGGPRGFGPPRDAPSWPQFQFGSPDSYRFVLTHHRDARPILIAAGVAWLVALIAWAVPHG